MSWAYLLEAGPRLILVDAGLPSQEQRILKRLRSLGRRQLDLIYITHAHLDHYGSAAALRRLTGAPIGVHHADGPAMAAGKSPLGSARGRGKVVQTFWPLFRSAWKLEPAPADLLFEDGQNIAGRDLQASVVHTPGHTVGSSTLLVEGRLAFVGDLVSSAGGLHVQRFFAHDWARLDASLTRLQHLEPETVFPGHGKRPIDGRELNDIER